jgi:predicted DNA binding CopG/RHH family protein
LALERGVKEGVFMKTRITYKSAPLKIGKAIQESRIIDDFLPPPGELVLKEKTKKITINLSEESLNFFKEAAKQYKVPYQQMIKELLDKYTLHYKMR